MIDTNNEAAKELAKLLFEVEEDNKAIMTDRAKAIKILIEFLNSPSKYSSEPLSHGYHIEHVEQAFKDILDFVRGNGKHFMDLGEMAYKRKNIFDNPGYLKWNEVSEKEKSQWIKEIRLHDFVRFRKWGSILEERIESISKNGLEVSNIGTSYEYVKYENIKSVRKVN